ncbi:hypothetical protein NFJ02_13g13970 [Pycnococcus provasolii]
MEVSRAGAATTTARRLPTASTATSSRLQRGGSIRSCFEAMEVSRAGVIISSMMVWKETLSRSPRASWHSLALRRDGSIACWGNDGIGQAPPAGVDGDFVMIAAGANHSMAVATQRSHRVLGNEQ